MQFSSAVILAALSLVSANAPPSCVLACAAEVSREKSCSGINDLKCIVDTNGSTLNSCLDSTCGDSKNDAVNAVKAAASAKNVSYNGSGSSSSSSASSSSATSSSAASSSSAPSSSAPSSSAPSSSSSSSSSAAATTSSSSSAAATTSSEAAAAAAATTSAAASSSPAAPTIASSTTSAAIVPNGAPAKEIAGAIAAVAVGAALL